MTADWRRSAIGTRRRGEQKPPRGSANPRSPDATKNGSWLLENAAHLPLHVLPHGVETDTHTSENRFSQGAGALPNESAAFPTAHPLRRPRRIITASHGTTSDHDVSGEMNPAGKQEDASLRTRILS